MRPAPNPIMQNAIKVAKRVSITILICIPFMIVVSWLLVIKAKIITADWQMILLFITIMGVAILVEEIVARKREKRKEAMKDLEKHRDVFK